MTAWRRSLLVLVVALSPILAFAPMSGAYAQSVRLIGDYNDWSAYATKDGAGQICFIVSKPTNVSPAPDDYSQGYLYLTNRPAQNIRNEFNFVAGYPFEPDSTATLTIGSHSFELFTQADAAWLNDVDKSQDVAGYMRAGSSLTVAGTTDKGIKVQETFSLSGATAASRAIDNACN